MADTTIRFGLRSLLLASVSVAVIAALVGAYSRQLPPDQASGVLWLWTGVVVGGMGWVTVATVQRYLIERRAGPAYARLTWTLPLLPKVARFLLLPWRVFMITLLVAVIVAWTWSVGQPGRVHDATNLCVAGAVVSMLLVSIVLATIWSRHVWLCERGIVHGSRMFPWQRITHHRWHRRHPDVLILTGFLRIATMIVPPEQREAVEALLNEKLQ